jgi:hypothetical protein
MAVGAQQDLDLWPMHKLAYQFESGATHSRELAQQIPWPRKGKTVAVPMVRRLAAGGSRIRTLGPSREGLRFSRSPRSITPAIPIPRRR